MTRLSRFADSNATDTSLVGGKGANLAVLTQAGFPVPPGFVVGATVYGKFLEASDLRSVIGDALARLDYADPVQLEQGTAEIRRAIVDAELPDGLADEISSAYADLGDDPYVAVRSSGTLEDGADASYAGLHDSFLDIRGSGAVADAVKRCWASLWTARATSYRETKGLDHLEVTIAVVVQVMVASEIAGVMYTGHPVTTATDEIVINASWGLGEAVVASLVDPDTYVVKANTLGVKERVLGTKLLRVVRAPAGGDGETNPHEGTVTEPVPEPDQARFVLSDAMVSDLAEIGRRVQAHYGGLPQDIEWAYASGSWFLVQTRPLTGVEFSWDAEVDEGLWARDEGEDGYVWTRDMADENWTGAITPLMYSLRAPAWVAGHAVAARQWGHPDLATMRFFKFYKAEAYYNSKMERAILERTLPPALRKFHVSGLAKLPPEWREETLNAPFSFLTVLKQYARVETLQPQLYKGFKTLDHYMNSDESLTRAGGLSADDVRRLSDAELTRYIEGQIGYEFEYLIDLWSWFFICARDMFLLLSYMVDEWYDGDTMTALAGLVTGVPRKTKTLEANHDLWLLAETIRKDPKLLDTFARAQSGGDFLASVESFAGGPALLEQYRSFLDVYGHRGHSDRDVYYPRRAEDPSLDFNALRAMLSGVLEHGDDAAIPDPSARELEVYAEQQRVYDEVLERIRRKPFGSVRAELFKLVHAYCIRFILARDDERHFIDHITYSIRRGFLELNRRLVDRGLVETDRDFWFLSRAELYALFEGRAPMPLTRMKMAARQRDFDRFNEKVQIPPRYLHRGHEYDFDAIEQDGDVLKGLGTARGKVSGIARVAKGLHDIGRVKKGEILIVNATDPGWTPVFSVISGIVLETGGMTAHGAMLAREYGLPAVQLAGAAQLIDDGALIEINGDTGTVVLLGADTVSDETGAATTNGSTPVELELSDQAGADPALVATAMQP